jgi:hypothetical protein
MSSRPGSAAAIGLCVAALFTWGPGSAGAVVVGKLHLRGAIALTAASTDFLPSGGGTGSFLVDPYAPNSGTFAGAGGSPGTLQDFTTATAPVGGAFALPNFLIVAALPSVSLTLTGVAPGVFPAGSCGAAPAAGQRCTPAGSAFNFVNTSATSSAVSFTLSGTAIDATGTPSQFRATLTTQFTGMTYQQVLAAWTGGTPVAAAFSMDVEALVEATPP